MPQRMSLMVLRVVLIAGAVAILGGCCSPILYKPTIEPQSLPALPRVPDKVGDLPGTPVGRRPPIRMTEFETRGNNPGPYGKGVYPKSVYRLSAYPDETSAKDEYQVYRDKFGPSSGMLVYGEAQANGWTFFVTFVMQHRSSPESFCRPQPYYHSAAFFWSRNVFIQINVDDTKKTSEAMVDAVQHVADVLAKEFKTDMPRINH